jgi:hypothetical protein
MRTAIYSALICLVVNQAKADFMLDTNITGLQEIKIDHQNTAASQFSAHIGTNAIYVTTTGTVDTGSGFATIKPDTGALTKLIFTPENGSIFNGFSFRGQLSADGSITVTVQDNQLDKPQTFTITGLKANQDFGPIGIVAVSGSGETIQSITLEGNFKSEKQNEFADPPSPVPVPGSLAMSGLLALTGLVYRRQIKGLAQWSGA